MPVRKTRLMSLSLAVGIWIAALFTGWTTHKIFSDWMGYSIEAWEMLHYVFIYFDESDSKIELLKCVPVLGMFLIQGYLLLRKRQR